MKVYSRKNVILYMMMALFSMTLTSLSTVVSEISKELPNSQSGLYFTLNFIGFVVFALLGGPLAQKIGKRTLIRATLIFYAFLFIVFFFSTSYIVQLCTVFCIGGAGGIIECIVSAYIADCNPSQKGACVNASQVFMSAGSIFTPIIMALMVSHRVNYHLYFLFLAAFSLILFFLFHTASYPAVSEKGQVSLFSTKPFHKKYGFTLALIGIFCYTGGEVASWGWLSSFLQKNNNFTVLNASLMVSLFWLSMTVGRYCCGLFLKKYSLASITLVLAVSSAAVMVVMAFTQTTWLLILCVILLGLTCSSQFPFLSELGAQHTEIPSALSYTFLMVCGNIGSSAIPYIAGVVESSVSVTASNLLLAFCFFMKAVSVWFISRIPER